MNEKIVEAVAESLWQAESRRAADRARLTSWPEESEKTREGWRFLARAAITAYQAEAWQGEEAEYEVWQDDMPISSASGPRDRALFDAMHYANIYGQDGPVTVMQVIRQPVLLPIPPSDRGET